MNLIPSAPIEELIEPIALCLTPEVAKKIADLRAPPELQFKLDELADRNLSGQLSREESEQYDSYVRALNFIGLLQTRAQASLNSTS